MGKVAGLTKFGFEIVKRFPVPQMSHVNILVTDRCNQRCLTCNIWQQNGQPKKDITAWDIDQIIAHNNLMWITLTGGEPSLVLDFWKILALCLRYTPLVHLNTNGYETSKIIHAVYNALAQSNNNLLVVNISMFGNQAHHDMITRVKDGYKHVIDTIEGLKGIRSNGRLMIGLAHTICQYNHNQYRYIEDMAKALNIGVTYAWERHTGFFNNEDGDSPRFNLPKPSFSLNPLNVFKNSFLMNPNRKAGCVAGEYSCWVDSRLNAYPCFWAVPASPSYNITKTHYDLDPHYFRHDKQWIKNCPGCWIACESYEMLMFRPWRVIK